MLIFCVYKWAHVIYLTSFFFFFLFNPFLTCIKYTQWTNLQPSQRLHSVDYISIRLGAYSGVRNWLILYAHLSLLHTQRCLSVGHQLYFKKNPGFDKDQGSCINYVSHFNATNRIISRPWAYFDGECTWLEGKCCYWKWGWCKCR